MNGSWSPHLKMWESENFLIRCFFGSQISRFGTPVEKFLCNFHINSFKNQFFTKFTAHPKSLGKVKSKGFSRYQSFDFSNQLRNDIWV